MHGAAEQEKQKMYNLIKTRRESLVAKWNQIQAERAIEGIL